MIKVRILITAPISCPAFDMLVDVDSYSIAADFLEQYGYIDTINDSPAREKSRFYRQHIAFLSESPVPQNIVPVKSSLIVPGAIRNNDLN